MDGVLSDILSSTPTSDLPIEMALATEGTPADHQTETAMDSPSTFSSNGAPAGIGSSGPSTVDEGLSSKEDTCPSCADDSRLPKKSSKTTHWVECEACGTWHHWDCVSKGESLSSIDKWYCAGCLQATPTLCITYKAPARKSSRKRPQPSYVSLNEGSSAGDPNKWMKLIEKKPIASDHFRRMNGADVNLGWLSDDPDALREPIVVEDPKGLGMRMPGWVSDDGPIGSADFGVDDVARIVGGETPVEVIDVATQSNSPGFNLAKWTEYYNSPASERDKVRNVISLEVSGTPLAQQITPPRLVRDIDWFHRFWPTNKRGKGQYPKVQLYCLMSVANCWTDMHVDFAGSSVFYHVLKGTKVFYFIRPTKANLLAYERWCGSEMQSSTWLGDLVDQVIKVELQRGHTMFIPTGWIHAVYTPVDSLVIGGNFLHSYDIATQLRVREIEIKTRVPKKFRFPLFQKMCWYAGDAYNRALKAKEDIPPRVLSGLRSLSDFLISEVRFIEGTAPITGDSGRKDARDMVPNDKVSDAPALAREFRWRLRLAMDGNSGDEATKPKTANGHSSGSAVPRSKRSTPATPATSSTKRKRAESDASSRSEGRNIFKNFAPRPWSYVKKEEGHLHRAGAVELPEEWTSVIEIGRRRDGGLERRTDSIVKMRRMESDEGEEVVEREVITRVREVWRAGAGGMDVA